MWQVGTLLHSFDPYRSPQLRRAVGTVSFCFGTHRPRVIGGPPSGLVNNTRPSRTASAMPLTIGNLTFASRNVSVGTRQNRRARVKVQALVRWTAAAVGQPSAGTRDTALAIRVINKNANDNASKNAYAATEDTVLRDQSTPYATAAHRLRPPVQGQVWVSK